MDPAAGGPARQDATSAQTTWPIRPAGLQTPFEVGGEYLVYAYFLGDGDLYTGICSRTNSLAVASEDLAQLGEPIFRSVATSVAPMSWGGVKRAPPLRRGSLEVDGEAG